MLSLIGVDTQNSHAESARFLIGDEDAVRGVPAAVEAMKLLYELAFDQLGLERVWGTIAADNRRMIKWQRYLGMREEGRLRNHYRIAGRFQDAVCLGILAEEYRGQARPRMEALIAAGRKEACR
jgi:diamine N-acetyltransferase